jgi:hypothetical protein
MTAPRRSGADQATTRGLIVLALAVVLGLGLLARSNTLIGAAGAGKSKPSSTTSTTAPPTTSPSTVVTANTGGGSGATTGGGTVHPPAQVKVLVVNASLESGVGSKNQTTLTGAGFDVVSVKNGPAIATTTIFYAPGYQADAAAVRSAIKVPTAQVVALPANPIVPAASTANVTVALGKDYKA